MRAKDEALVEQILAYSSPASHDHKTVMAWVRVVMLKAASSAREDERRNIPRHVRSLLGRGPKLPTGRKTRTI